MLRKPPLLRLLESLLKRKRLPKKLKRKKQLKRPKKRKPPKRLRKRQQLPLIQFQRNSQLNLQITKRRKRKLKKLPKKLFYRKPRRPS